MPLRSFKHGLRLSKKHHHHKIHAEITDIDNSQLTRLDAFIGPPLTNFHSSYFFVQMVMSPHCIRSTARKHKQQTSCQAVATFYSSRNRLCQEIIGKYLVHAIVRTYIVQVCTDPCYWRRVLGSRSTGVCDIPQTRTPVFCISKQWPTYHPSSRLVTARESHAKL